MLGVLWDEIDGTFIFDFKEIVELSETLPVTKRNILWYEYTNDANLRKLISETWPNDIKPEKVLGVLWDEKPYQRQKEIFLKF